MLNMSRARPAAAPSGTPLPAMPPPPALPPKAKASGKAIERKMPQHVLPPYVEANFRLMTFIMTRAPKLEDFPHERCAAPLPHTAFEHPPHTLSPLSPLLLLVCLRRMYTKEGIDLLFRHYYKNSRA